MAIPSYGYDFTKEATTTTGTGDYALAGPVTGFVAFGDNYSDGDRLAYVVTDGAGNFEVGLGQYNATPNTITRLYVSNWNGPVVSGKADWAAGTKYIYVDMTSFSTPLTLQQHINSQGYPGLTNDLSQGYDVMSMWLSLPQPTNPTIQESLFVCSDPTTGAAKWQRLKPIPFWWNQQMVTGATRLNDAGGAVGKIAIPDGGIARIRAQIVATGTSGSASWQMTSFWARGVGAAPSQVGATAGSAPDFYNTPLSTTFGAAFVVDADNVSVGIETTVDNTNGVKWGVDLEVTSIY